MEEKQFPKVVVGVVIYNSSGEIFIAKGNKWDGRWVLVGGHVEWGETMEQCAKREELEETGLKIDKVEFMSLQESIFSPEFHKPKHMIFVDHCALCLGGEVVLNNESSEYVWIKPQEALASLNLGSSTKISIQNFIHLKG